MALVAFYLHTLHLIYAKLLQLDARIKLLTKWVSYPKELTWYTAGIWSQITVRRHVATNMFWPSKCFAAAFVWTDPLFLAAVMQQVSLKLTGCCECPATAELRAHVRTLTSMHALMLLESTQTIKTSTTTIKLTLQLLAANKMLSTMWHHVPLVCERHSTARIRTAVTHASQFQSVIWH